MSAHQISDTDKDGVYSLMIWMRLKWLMW